MKADVPGTLQKVAAIGFKEVEFAGLFGQDSKGRPRDARQERPDLARVAHRLEHRRDQAAGDESRRRRFSGSSLSSCPTSVKRSASSRTSGSVRRSLQQEREGLPAGRPAVRVSPAQLRVRAVGRSRRQAALRLPAREHRSGAREDGAGYLLDGRGRAGSRRLLQSLPGPVPAGARQGLVEGRDRVAGLRRCARARTRSSLGR